MTPLNASDRIYNDVPPSSDSWDIRTEINTRLWYAHGAITPTSEEMERMVTSMEALLLSAISEAEKRGREEVIELAKLYDEYTDFLCEEEAKNVGFLYTHGIQVSEASFKKGEDFRKKIKECREAIESKIKKNEN